MQPEDIKLYRVTEKILGSPPRRYVAFAPRNGPEGLEWVTNWFNQPTRYESGTLQDRGPRGFALVPSQARRPLCVFEPLTLENAKELSFFSEGEFIADWDDDDDVLAFFHAYFRAVDLSASTQIALETRGIPAKVGAIHPWKDGDYQKRADGSWRKVGSEYGDEHPDVPKSTMAQHFRDGSWEPERLKMQEKILEPIRERVFRGIHPVPKGERLFTFIIGPPAAGKSTKQGDDYHNAAKIDPDEILVEMPEFQKAKDLKVRSGASSVVAETLQMNNRLVNEAKEKGYNFVLAGTGQNLEWMTKKFFPDLKERGYKINVVMAYVEDLDELLLRSESRGNKSARFIAPERTTELHEILPMNFKALIANRDVDGLALMDSHVEAKVGPDGKSSHQQRQIYTRTWTPDGWNFSIDDDQYFDRLMGAADAAEKKAAMKAAKAAAKGEAVEKPGKGRRVSFVNQPNQFQAWLDEVMVNLKSEVAAIDALPDQFTRATGIDEPDLDPVVPDLEK